MTQPPTDAAREAVRLAMLQCPPLSGERDTYEDGFKQGLCRAIEIMDATRQQPEAGREGALEIARQLMVQHFGPGKSSAVPAEWVIDAMLEFAATRLAVPTGVVREEVDEGLHQALAWAYTQGATDVHEEWRRDPDDCPRGDLDFAESASDYAKAALDPFSSAARVPDAVMALLSHAEAGGVEVPSGWKAGDVALYTGVIRPIQVTLLANIEGWWEVRCSDDSTAIVRPSRLSCPASPAAVAGGEA